MVLDRNPDNFFAEVEQSGFSPANLVPGIGLSPDKMLMGRIFSYHDTHLHRIGPNYEQLPINSPKVEVHSYNFDGPMTYIHSGDQPVYAPNSKGGPVADGENGADLTWEVEGGELGRYDNAKHAEDDDFGQAGTLLREMMDDTERDALVENIVGHASAEVTAETQDRVVAYWTNVDPEIGKRVAAGLERASRRRRRRRPRFRAASETSDDEKRPSPPLAWVGRWTIRRRWTAWYPRRLRRRRGRPSRSRLRAGSRSATSRTASGWAASTRSASASCGASATASRG